MKKLVLLGLFVYIFLVFSCTSPITMNQISKIERGMSVFELHSLLKKTPENSFVVMYNEKRIVVEIYKMQTGTQTHTGFSAPTKFGPGHAYSYESAVSEDYAFVFYKNKLLYWGFFDEFHKSEITSIQELGEIISNKCKKNGRTNEDWSSTINSICY